jgi:3-deoxy-7-phosphoheptulonate synthase
MESLPSYNALKERLPLSASNRSFISKNRGIVQSILRGEDQRLLLIVGPCSIHEKESALEYARKLHALSLEVSDQFFLVMRIYCEKPRTAYGWKGFLHDPLLDGSNTLKLGIEWTRELLLTLAEMGVPAATEFLDPLTAFYYNDLITWGSIGARTTSSQTHRQLASGLNIPIGFKNGVAGNVSAAVHGALSASLPHTFMGLCPDGTPSSIRTTGNPDTHIVLRGGDYSGPNYDPSSVSKALAKLESVKLPARLLIDCSHQNSGKQFDRQPTVFQSVIHQIAEGNANIQGLMLESHLYGGNQGLPHDLSELQYGVSITDSCLDWASTARLIIWATQHLNQELLTHQPLSHQ